jgi:ABC-type branched-subunit amino acid transport system ATPase component
MTALIEVEDIAKAFGGLQALDGCSLSVERGAIAGLIGPNGSGKTTLFNVITGFTRSDRGQVRLDRQPITGAGPDRVFALGVGRTFQLTRVFTRMTVLENMLVATQRHEGWLRSLVRSPGSHDEGRRAMELLDLVGLTRLVASPAGTLSYGQRKLLELAYVLVADPAVLLLDEPAAGVNPSVLNKIRDLIVELNAQGKTFMIVEHNMEFVMGLCHSVTVMHQGRALVTGPPAQVRNDPRVLDAYLGGGR